MPRRIQRMSRAKARTAWLAWCAWAMFGSIFVFEDTAGGSGVFAWIFTAPFWVLFALWPFLWVWLKFRRDPHAVDIDDDITVEGLTARLVRKDGVDYVEIEPFCATFKLPEPDEEVHLPGGNERFARLEHFRAQAAEHPQLAAWIAQVDALD